MCIRDRPVLHFIVGAFLIRFLTTEQSYGVVSLMRTLGMGPDQLRPLFVVILAGVVTGIIGTAVTFGPKRLIPQLLMAILLLGSAAFFDQNRTAWTVPTISTSASSWPRSVPGCSWAR